jgi:3-deoxy-D-manno-octulosonate 8-phosphate phosphatase (KDO 8-P phosphatase)
MEKNFKELLNNITTFVFDVDGVLTDGSVILMPGGEQIRNMNIKDGFALQLAVKKGYRIAVITGGKSEFVRTRLNGLGIKDIYLGAHDKLAAFNDFIHANDLTSQEVLYMGDDVPDYDVMKRVGVATCPADAASEIKSICKYISQKPGGKGCVRDVVEQVMKVQDKWNVDEDGHW